MSDNNNENGSSNAGRNLAIFAAILVIGIGIAVMYMHPRFQGPNVATTDAYVFGDVVSIGPRFDARIAKIHVDIGEPFSAGDILVEFERDYLEAELKEAEASLQLAEAEAQAFRTEIELDNQRDLQRRAQAVSELKSLEATLRAARLSSKNAEREFDRFRNLAEDGVASTARLDVAREDRQIARSEVREIIAQQRVAKASLELAEIAISRKDVKAAELTALEASVDREQARIQTVKADIGATALRAPGNGKVTEILVQAGGAVRPSDPVLTYWMTDSLWVNAWVSETDASKIKKGMTATVKVDALGDAPAFSGVVDAVLVAPDGKARTLPGRPVSPLLPDRSRFAVRILVNQDDWSKNVLPGMSVDVEIATKL